MDGIAGPLAWTVAAYVAVAGLLMSLNLASLWRWEVKAAAIGVTTAFFAGSYLAIAGLLGYPSPDRPPERFQLLWSRIVEPDKATGEAGAIYLWVETLDAENTPSGAPRAYAVAYSDELADQIAKAQERREEGFEIAGVVESEEEATAETRPMGAAEREGRETTRMDTTPFMEQALRMSFEDLPPPVLPPKPPL